VVAESWEWWVTRCGLVELDEWMIMPNHMHGIIVITDACTGGSRTAPTGELKPIGRLVGAFKTAAAKRINDPSAICATPLAPKYGNVDVTNTSFATTRN